MLAARRSAREALSDMAQQNARLVSAYVEKKQELRHLQDNIREERLQWQVAKHPQYLLHCIRKYLGYKVHIQSLHVVHW